MSILDEPNLKEKVALGLVPGWRILRKFGMNDDVPSGTEEMWPLGTAKIWPTSAAAVSVTSDSAEDDPNEATPPGTGAWTVTIEGLDANYEEISETITMTGTTPSLTTALFYRVNRAFAATAGTNEINVGNITGTIGGNPQFYIEAAEGQTHQTHYTVPADHTWLIEDYHLAIGRMGGSTDLHIMGQIRLNGGANNESWRSITDIYLWNGGNWDNQTGATLIPAKTDVRQIIVSTTTTQANAVIEGFLIKNDRFDI